MQQDTIEKTIKTQNEQISWSDIQFNSLIKIIDARGNGNIEKYRSLVTALELILYGHIDDPYKRDIEILKHQKNKIETTEGNEQADLFYFDEKLKALSELLYRINRGVERVRQRFIGSDVVKEIAKNNIDGIGQNLFITGSPGSGKSYTAIRIANEITNITKGKFKQKTHIVFSPQQFINIYNDEKKTPPGSVIIFDEAGVTNNSKDNYDDGVKVFNKLLQTIRHRAITVIMTAPDLGLITKDSRKLLHWWFETVKIIKKENVCLVKPFTVQLIQRDGKIIYPFPEYDGKKVTQLEIEKIEDKDIKTYEAIAKEYKDDLALESQISLSMIENDKVTLLKKFSKLREDHNIKETCQEMNIHTNTGTKLERLRKQIMYSQ